MVKLINCDQTVIKGLDSKPFHCESEGGVGAHKRSIAAFQKLTNRIDLSAILARGIAKIPVRPDRPVRPESELC